MNNQPKLTANAIHKIMKSLGYEKLYRDGSTGVVGSNNLINYYTPKYKGDYSLKCYKYYDKIDTIAIYIEDKLLPNVKNIVKALKDANYDVDYSGGPIIDIKLKDKVDESMNIKENLNSKILYKIYNYDLDKYEKRLTSNINKVKDYLKANIGDEIAIFVNEFKLVKEKEVYNEEKDMKVSALYNFPDSGKQIKKQVIKEENIDKIINSLTQCTNNSTEDLKYFDIKVANNGELKDGYLVYGNPKPFNDYYNFYDVTYKANNKQFSIIAAVSKSLESVRDIDKYLLLDVLPEVNNSLVHSVKYIEDIEVKKKKLTESLNENNNIQLKESPKYKDLIKLNDTTWKYKDKVIIGYNEYGKYYFVIEPDDLNWMYSGESLKDLLIGIDNELKDKVDENMTLENNYEDEVIESYNILDEDIREKEYNVVIDNIEWSAENEDLPSSIQHDFFLSPYDNLEDEIYSFLLEYSNGVAPLGYSIDYNSEEYYVDDNIDEDEVYYGESWSNGSFSYMTPLDYIERDLQDENINYELTQVDDYTYITIQDNQDNIRKADDIICNIVGDQYEKINKGNEVDFKIPDNELSESLKEDTFSLLDDDDLQDIENKKIKKQQDFINKNGKWKLVVIYRDKDTKEETTREYDYYGQIDKKSMTPPWFYDAEKLARQNLSNNEEIMRYDIKKVEEAESLKESTNISSNDFGVAKMYGPSSLSDLERLAKQKEKVYLEQEWGGKVHGFWIAASTLARQLKNGQAKIYDEISDKFLKEDFNQQQLTQDVIKALNSTNDIVYHKDYEIYPEADRLKLVFERVSKRDNAWGALWEFDKEDDEVEWQYIYVYGKDNSGLKESKNEAIEYGKGKYEPKKITAFNHYTAPKYNSELHKKFQDDAKKEEYWIVKEDSWYDPEDLSSITNSITFAGSKEDCENTLKQIKNDAHNDKNVNIENEGNDFIEIYYPNNISRVTYRLIKNNNKNESLKEEKTEIRRHYGIPIYAEKPVDNKFNIGEKVLYCEGGYMLYPSYMKAVIKDVYDTRNGIRYDLRAKNGYDYTFIPEDYIKKLNESLTEDSQNYIKQLKIELDKIEQELSQPHSNGRDEYLNQQKSYILDTLNKLDKKESLNEDYKEDKIEHINSYFNAWSWPCYDEIQEVINFYQLDKDATLRTLGKQEKYKDINFDDYKYYNMNESLKESIKRRVVIQPHSGISAEGFNVYIYEGDKLINKKEYRYGYNASYSKEWAEIAHKDVENSIKYNWQEKCSEKPYVTDILEKVAKENGLSLNELEFIDGEYVFNGKVYPADKFKSEYLKESLKESLKEADKRYQFKVNRYEHENEDDFDIEVITAKNKQEAEDKLNNDEDINWWDEIDNYNSEDESNGRYDYIDSKQVYDSDGFITEYTMYYDTLDNKYVFVFGDSDLYKPEDEDFDWECETRDEAEQWFRNYNGFEDDLDECNLKESNDPLDNIIADDLKKQLDKNITRILSPATGNWIKDDIPTVSREEYAVRYYFGIGDMADWTPHSIKEIADRFQVKPNRIRLFLKNGIKKLQNSKYFQGKDLSDFKQLLTSNESVNKK